MTAKKALEQISGIISEKRNELYKEVAFANEHNFELEAIALRYKIEAYSDIQGEVLMMLHNIG